MRTARRHFGFLTLAFLLIPALGLVGCKKKDDSGKSGKSGKETITVAVCGPITGSASAFGAMIKKGAELAAVDINAAGGINGKDIVINIQDDKGDPKEATTVARKLANDMSIPIVIGHFNSACSNSAKEEYNDVGVVSLSPGSTNVHVCKGYKWTFRNLYQDKYQGEKLAAFMSTQLKVKKVAVFYDNDDYGKGLMGFFKAAAEKAGIKVLEPIPYNRERTQDFKPLVGRIVDQKPDAIFVSGLYNEGALICKAARVDLGMKDVIFIGGDGLVSPDFAKTAGKSAEGAYLSTPFLFDPDKATEKAKTFFAAFKKKFGKDPDTWAALTYDAVMMAAEAMKEVGTDREKIRAWFAAKTTPEKAFIGVTGPTYFDNEGDCKKPIVFVQIIKGQMRLSAKQLGN